MCVYRRCCRRDIGLVSHCERGRECLDCQLEAGKTASLIACPGRYTFSSGQRSGGSSQLARQIGSAPLRWGRHADSPWGRWEAEQGPCGLGTGHGRESDWALCLDSRDAGSRMCLLFSSSDTSLHSAFPVVLRAERPLDSQAAEFCFSPRLSLHFA